ncbi:MAG: hypothetical protein Q9217_004968 [Psora testacea]
MSLAVKHLNGDTTFLLTFSPIHQPPPSPNSQYHQSPGTFTVLIDPWLSGSTSMWHPKFLLSRHTAPSCIQHLSQIPEPNVVLISQVKPDHCHEATLRQLNPTSSITTVLAEPAAAKKIRSMKHFHPSMIHSLRPFSDKKPDSIIRFFIPPTIPGGTPGEVTISFTPAKIDVAGVHNAIGMTYRPPSSICVPSRPFSSNSSTSRQYSFEHKPKQQYPTNNLPMTPPDSPLPHNGTYTNCTTPTSSVLSNSFSPSDHASVSSVSSLSFQTGIRQPTERAISLIYSPHGVDYSLIWPYASSHLVQTAALPLTLLLHSFDRVANPWWMGGNIAAGLPGGVEIARNLMARCWISAHDEEKDNSGISVANVKTRRYTTEEVGSLMSEEGGFTKVLKLDVGEEVILKA